jgi:hypothetical protein
MKIQVIFSSDRLYLDIKRRIEYLGKIKGISESQKL